MATAVFTEVEARVDQPLTNAIYADQIQDNVNQLAGAHRNLLVNGGFEVAQRGAGPFTAAGAWTLDRWQLLETAPGAGSVTRETTIVETNSGASLAVVVSGISGGSGLVDLAQVVEQHVQLRGQTVSFSMRVRQSVANGAHLFIGAGGGTPVNVTGASSATTGQFVTLTATATLPTDATSLQVLCEITANGTYYLDNAMLVIGPAPAPYRPLHPQEELARCQRYYEITSAELQSYMSAGNNIGLYVPYVVTKGGTPTTTKNGTWAVVNCAQPSVLQRTGFERYGITIFTPATALGQTVFSTNSADDTITVEWNP